MKSMTQVSIATLAIAAIAGCAPETRQVFTPGEPSELAQKTALEILEEELEQGDYGIAMSDIEVKRVHVDDLAMAHTRVQQTFGGVPVFGGEAIVHLQSDGSLFAITDGLARHIALAGAAAPVLSPDDAVDEVLAKYDCPSCLTAEPEADLWVARRGGEDRLAYRVKLWREDGTDATSMPVTFVDAGTGATIFGYENLQTATGASLFSGNVTISTYTKAGKYYLESPASKMGTFDSRNVQFATYRFWDENDVWDAPAQKAAVDVHYCTKKFLEYFQAEHNRNGIDGSGGPGYYTAADGVTKLISSKIHYGSAFNNAYWNGFFMTYGDGDGASFLPLVTLDICGHEMQHGITEHTAELVYEGESGALNESWSDVFGALLERYVNGESELTWRIGEACYTPGNGQSEGLRDMADPHVVDGYGLTMDDDPDHYSERYTGQEDGGGVHINSGISNKAFYLLAVGGTHHMGGSMAGIGADKAGKIWYLALTSYMVSSTSFKGARAATMNAAAALYGAGGPTHTAVGTAWSMVGVK